VEPYIARVSVSGDAGHATEPQAFLRHLFEP
jgi:hypothetical protein